MKEIAISIIIPVYNVQDYIRKCIISVVNQTFKNFELIIVNDQTKDDSIKFIEEVLEKYDNIDYKIINRAENGGLSAARNSGLEIAKGKYVCFLDSDDWWHPEMLEKLYTRGIENNADIVCSNYFEVFNKNEIEIVSCTNKILFSSIDACKEALLFRAIKPSAWSKIFKLELFKKNNIIFPEGRYFEDVPTIIGLILAANRILVIHDYLYYYVKTRSGSIMNQKKIKSIHDYLYMVQLVQTILCKNSFDNLIEFEIFKYNTLKGAFLTLQMIKGLSIKKYISYSIQLSKMISLLKKELIRKNVTLKDGMIFNLISNDFLNYNNKKASSCFYLLFRRSYNLYINVAHFKKMYWRECK